MNRAARIQAEFPPGVTMPGEFNFIPPATGSAIVERARARQPNFEAWVNEGQKKRNEG